MKPTLATILFLILIAGCGDNQSRPSSPPVVQPVNRFIQVHSGNTGPWYIALDTQTGQLCKTYPWPDEQNKQLIQGLPECFYLYGAYPSIGTK